MISRNDDMPTFTGDQFGLNRRIVFVSASKLPVIIGSPKNILLCGMVSQKNFQYFRIFIPYFVF
jgi:hypothetical protein